MSQRLFITLPRLLALALLAVAPCARAADGGPAMTAAPPLTVFAAASLTNVLQQIGDTYTKATGQAVKFSFAGTQVLARQIESGGRVDVFISADQEWMDYVEARGLLEPGTRSDLLGNRLVLVAPVDSALKLDIKAGFSAALLGALGESGRLSMADPDAVPAGRYARAALTQLGAWKDLQPRIARSENVRAALVFVVRGEAPLGIVYATDARAEPKVRVVGEFPAGSHPPIRYPVAQLRGATESSFLKYLRAPAARSAFVAAGFEVIEP